MKAPDKIYVAELSKQHPSTEWCVGLACKTNNLPVATTEYIHKDAILKWAEKKKNDVKKFGQRYNEANYYNSGCHDTIQGLIDKLNSL